MLNQSVSTVPPLRAVRVPFRATGLVAGTIVTTDQGDLPVERLLAGDRVRTVDGSYVELRGTSMVTARNVDMVTFSPMAILSLTGKVAGAMSIPARQPIRIRDWRATILAGAPTMMADAASQVDDILVTRARQLFVDLYQLHFDMPQVLSVNGLELGCATRRSPEMPRRVTLH
ncbi:MAG: Hint domain-containing protein [Paracoccaceae bacterium]